MPDAGFDTLHAMPKPLFSTVSSPKSWKRFWRDNRSVTIQCRDSLSENSVHSSTVAFSSEVSYAFDAKSSGKSKLQGAVYERALRRKAKRSRAPTIVIALIGVFGSGATPLKPVQRRLCRRLLPRHSKARDSERSRDPVSRLHHTVAGQ